MTDEPNWILRSVIDAMHDMQLSEHGGSPGLRDEGLLESALARPKNSYLYGESDLFALAASYAFGLIRNHPYVDGNKRTAFLAAFVFLKINGIALIASEPDATHITLDFAADQKGEAEFAEWLRMNSSET